MYLSQQVATRREMPASIAVSTLSLKRELLLHYLDPIRCSNCSKVTGFFNGSKVSRVYSIKYGIVMCYLLKEGIVD